MFIYALLTVLASFLFLQIVSAQAPIGWTSTCPDGYFCGFGTSGPSGTTAFTYGPATITAPPQPIPTIPGIVQVDDTDPRITYSPPLLWKAATVGGCPICFGNPNDTETFNRTWHEGRRTMPSTDGPLTAIFNFTGTGISVYAILPVYQRADGLNELTAVSFLMDGAPTSAANWTWNPPPFNPSNWNVSLVWFQQEIFNSPPLPPGDHSLQMIGPSQGDSWFLLDYVAYRTDDASESQSLSNVVTPSVDASASDGSNVSGTRTQGTVTPTPVGSANPSKETTQSTNNSSRKFTPAVSLSLLWAFFGATSTIVLAGL